MIPCPHPPGQTAAAPDATPPTSGAVFTVTLSPAVLLILQLIETAKPEQTRDQLIGLGICFLAEIIGVPTLARDRPELDLADVPLFERAQVSRFGGNNSRSFNET